MRLRVVTQGIYSKRKVLGYGLAIERMRIFPLYGMAYNDTKWFRL